MVLFGSGMSYGHSHSNSNLPILLAGGRGLGLKHGQHIDYNHPEGFAYTLELRRVAGPLRQAAERQSPAQQPDADHAAKDGRRSRKVRGQHGSGVGGHSMTAAAALLAAFAGLGATAAAAPDAGTPKPVAAVLEQVDFIHRTGRCRICPAGEIVAFDLAPDAVVETVGADADLRDLPLGTAFEFTLERGADGRRDRATVIRDRFSVDALAGVAYRVEAVNADAGMIRVVPLARVAGDKKEPSPGAPTEFRTNARTQIWKGDKKVTLAALQAGDEIRVNRGGVGAAVCTEIWAGRDPQAAASARQRQHYADFVKARGLPARVERTEGRTLTLAIFGGEPATAEETWPGDSSRPGKGLRVAVANDELRTWNPPVDNEFGKIVELVKDPSGRRARLVVTVNFMLEGFRRGRYVRVFPDAWRTQDQPFGEQLFHYGARRSRPISRSNRRRSIPSQYPFRTDYGNTNLPWYQLQPGVAPPPDSEHRVFGELLSVGADHRSGRFRPDGAAGEVEFSLISGAKVRSLNADADLGDLSVGEQYEFYLYQDGSGAFRRASFVTDEVSDLVRNGAAWRVESLNRDEGTLIAARQPPGVRNDQGDPEQPPDIGRALLRFGPNTRVWKGDKRADLAALSVGDLLLINQTGDRPNRPAHCTDVWIGADVKKPLPNVRPAQRASSPPKGPTK